MDIKGYINRIRHNRGYGVQSPSAFFFVTEVLGEKLPYQAYPEIERITGKKGTFCTKRAKDLFRITNYTKPASCIAVESPVAASVMALAEANVAQSMLSGQSLNNIAYTDSMAAMSMGTGYTGTPVFVGNNQMEENE